MKFDHGASRDLQLYSSPAFGEQCEGHVAVLEYAHKAPQSTRQAHRVVDVGLPCKDKLKKARAVCGPLAGDV